MPKRVKCKCQDPTAVALLARISDKEKQGQASLERQLQETRELLVEPRGWRVVAEYQVKHRGWSLSRDATYMRMIRDAPAGKFAVLCLHKFDRLARRAYDREVFWHILTQAGVQVQAALPPYDLTTRAGKLTKKTSEFIADVFLDNLAEEVMKGMIQKVTIGGWVARAPFGYVNRREELAHNRFRRWVEVDPVHGPTATMVFRIFGGGQHTLDTMAHWLNARGYLRSRGLPWRRDRVRRLLTNPFYVGLIRWNGLEAERAHEALIDAETFSLCRAVLRRHDETRERRSRHLYAVNRLLRFEELGCGSHAEHQAQAGISYYRSMRPGPEGSKICIPCQVVDAQVGDLLGETEIPSALHRRIRRAYRREIAELSAPMASEVDRLRRRIAELEEESRGCVRLRAQEKITEAEFDQERARVSGAIAAAQGEFSVAEEGGNGRLGDLDFALALCGHLGDLRGAGGRRPSEAHCRHGLQAHLHRQRRHYPGLHSRRALRLPGQPKKRLLPS